MKNNRPAFAQKPEQKRLGRRQQKQQQNRKDGVEFFHLNRYKDARVLSPSFAALMDTILLPIDAMSYHDIEKPTLGIYIDQHDELRRITHISERDENGNFVISISYDNGMKCKMDSKLWLFETQLDHIQFYGL